MTARRKKRGGPISDEQHFKNVETQRKRRAKKALTRHLLSYVGPRSKHLSEDLADIITAHNVLTHGQLMQIMRFVRDIHQRSQPVVIQTK